MKDIAMDGQDVAKNELVKLLTPAQAAEVLSVSERTLWSLSDPRGPIPVIRLKRSVRYCPHTLRSWIAAQLVVAGAKQTSIGSKA